MIFLADTVVLTHAQPSTSEVGYSELPSISQELLEKPASKTDNLRMLLDLNGAVCEVVTGIVIGTSLYYERRFTFPKTSGSVPKLKVVVVLIDIIIIIS